MAPTYKLEYFNIKARGEPLRYMFKLAGVEFEDKRVDFKEWDNGGKDASPMGHVPLLTIGDGSKSSVVFESLAIGRYLAIEFGLMGKDREESTKIDCAVCAVNECFGPFIPNMLIFYQTEEKLNTERERFHRLYLSLLTKFLVTELGKSTSGWLIGDSVSYADCMAYSFYKDVVEVGISAQMVQDVPQILKDFFAKFRAIPAIDKWHKEQIPLADFEKLRATRGAEYKDHYVDE